MKNIIKIKDLEYFYKFLNHKTETEIRIFNFEHRIYPFPKNFQEFLAECKLHNGKRLLYAGINERKHNGRTANDVINFETIVIDIDAIREKGFEKQMATEKELDWVWDNVVTKILLFYEEMKFKQPLIVASGNGFQLFSKIPPIKITDANRDIINSKSRNFHSLLQKKFNPKDKEAIDNIGDLPRIIKITGTMNVKGNGLENRPHRLAKFTNVDYTKPIKDYEDINLKNFILSLESMKKTQKSRKDYHPPKIIHTVKFDEIPDPINTLLYKLILKSSNGWMRIISIFASFFQSIGLDKENCMEIIFNWQDRQTLHEEGEYEDIEKIINDIYRKKISCPNNYTILETSSGFPNMGIKDVLKYHKITFKNLRNIKNPVQMFFINRSEYVLPKQQFIKQFMSKRSKYSDFNIKKTAKKYHLTTCPFCQSDLIFNELMGKYYCPKCKNFGEIKKLFESHNLSFDEFLAKKVAKSA